MTRKTLDEVLADAGITRSEAEAASHAAALAPVTRQMSAAEAAAYAPLRRVNTPEEQAQLDKLTNVDRNGHRVLTGTVVLTPEQQKTLDRMKRRNNT